ncbi:MAG TPA: hypothetical protein PK280_04910 [Planctomycetota bacterium]|nr:hypothetical protein [Planctomycetota bacterium]
MGRITVGEAKPGMILERPITDQQGRVIVNSGASLSTLYISRLEKWGVRELFVVEGAAAPAAPAAVPAAAADAEPVPARDLPPGVYRGPDLADRVRKTFSRVQSDPVMASMQAAVLRALCGGAGGR